MLLFGLNTLSLISYPTLLLSPQVLAFPVSAIDEVKKVLLKCAADYA